MLRSIATFLHLCGALPAGRPVVALVGARAASRRGVAQARGLAAELAEGGAVILSGGALGIDAAAHEGALSRTVAVLANGLDQPYPARNAGLFREIVARGGGLVSPFARGTPPRRWQFLRRNEVIADLAEAVVVVEAGARSGSLHTARAAAERNKVLGACPGSPGTDALLRAGAAVVTDAADVLAALAGTPRRMSRPVPEAGTDEAEAWAALESAADAGTVAERVGWTMVRAARALMALELDGLAVALAGGRWARA